jgi:sulfur-carrier protein
VAFVATLRLFAGAREAAGTGRATIDAPTVSAVVDAAVAQFGSAFAQMLPVCRIWLNGEPATGTEPVGASDEVAILPPVSGGA